MPAGDDGDERLQPGSPEENKPMMTPIPHDPVLCDLPVCARCDAYGDGYAAGKAKAHFELRLWETAAHAPGCGCEPCETVRVIVRKAGDAVGNFAIGKAKAHVELRTWEFGAHAPGCDCLPCETVRVIVRKVVPHIGDCEGLGVCEGCACWCHAVEP